MCDVRPGIDIIVGPMFSGKTTELRRHLSTASEVELHTLYINHCSDVRNQFAYSTHNPLTKEDANIPYMTQIKVNKLEDVPSELIHQAKMIGVDEAQFFPSLDEVRRWADKLQKKVIVCGLDGTAKQTKFGCILDLIPHCDNITKIHAKCQSCARKKMLVDAIFTHKLLSADQTAVVDVGSHDKYQSLCRNCYNEAT